MASTVVDGIDFRNIAGAIARELGAGQLLQSRYDVEVFDSVIDVVEKMLADPQEGIGPLIVPLLDAARQEGREQVGKALAQLPAILERVESLERTRDYDREKNY